MRRVITIDRLHKRCTKCKAGKYTQVQIGVENPQMACSECDHKNYRYKKIKTRKFESVETVLCSESQKSLRLCDPL